MDRWRFADALHHYRGAAAIHPYDPRGHIGAAQCLAAMDQRATAITELTSVAREITKRGHNEAARALMAEALRLDPSQLELHVDLAELEIESGERIAGLARLHELAMAYFAARRIEEGRSVLDAI